MRASIKTIARAGGVLYLINIVFGFFAIGYIPGLIIINGNPEATAHSILMHESLYRLGIVAHIVILLTNIPLAVIFYHLFKMVSRQVTLVVVFCTLVGTAIEAANLLNQFVPLILLKASYLGEFTPGQLQSLAYLPQQLESVGFNLALVFFGFYCISIGYLVIKSAFLPQIAGALMTIGGVCYLVNSFANFLAPKVARHLFPYIQIPSGLAELTFSICLLIMSLNVKKWKLKANDFAVQEI